MRYKWMLVVLLLFAVTIGIWKYRTIDITWDTKTLESIDFGVLAEHEAELRQNGFVFDKTTLDPDCRFHDSGNEYVDVDIQLFQCDETSDELYVKTKIFRMDYNDKRYTAEAKIRKYDKGYIGYMTIWVDADSKREASRIMNEYVYALFTNYTLEIEK